MAWRSGRSMRVARGVLAAWLLVVMPSVVAAQAAPATAVAATLPERLSDREFWDLVTAISEPGGYFRIQDNFTSNEGEIGVLFNMLRERGVQGGVYMGVGPEQNLTYMAAIKPAMAFIVDIRRQAVMQHLMFKAVFELSPERADFIAMLFSKPRPEGLEVSTPIQRMWERFWAVRSDTGAYRVNRDRIVDHLTKVKGFTFTAQELDQLYWVYENFFRWGPQIATRGYATGGQGNGSTFADLTGYSVDPSGQPQSFLSSDEHYRTVKTLHEKNLVVPVSGDFGGPRAIRAIGAWLKERNAVVSAFYVSNVEQYLFSDGKARAFYDNTMALPVNEQSVFIRPYSLLRRFGFNYSLCGMAAFQDAIRAGLIDSRTDDRMCVRS